jgi:hypothetical protein
MLSIVGCPDWCTETTATSSNRGLALPRKRLLYLEITTQANVSFWDN